VGVIELDLEKHKVVSQEVAIKLDTRTVDVHIGRLRQALGATKGKVQIRTVRGFG